MTDRTTNAGKVYLVGAGPGDPDLLTVKARRLIETADVICYDALIGDGILDLFPSTATTIDVGKRPRADGTRTTQAEINELLVERARSGDVVARLKGGDPTVYGRGGEEAEHLASAGIPVEIVPGVTSVVAAPGVVGIPLTHREHASSVTVITGHETPTKNDSALDKSALAANVRAGGTLVVLMGVSTLPETVDWLAREGVGADTPAAMIERATWEDEQVVTGTLATIVDRAERAEISPPAITVIGDVVRVREQIKAVLERDADAVGLASDEWLGGSVGEWGQVSISPGQ